MMKAMNKYSTPIDRLEVWMMARGMTRTDLAHDLSVSLALVSLVLAGKRNPSDKLKWKFAEAYGHDAARVVFGNGQETVP
jgi:transcriptional regulator with XRE-family HTH domain